MEVVILDQDYFQAKAIEKEMRWQQEYYSSMSPYRSVVPLVPWFDMTDEQRKEKIEKTLADRYVNDDISLERLEYELNKLHKLPLYPKA